MAAFTRIQVPGTLAVQGGAGDAVAVLEFRRRLWAPVQCRYSRSNNPSPLNFVDCNANAKPGDLIETDQVGMTLSTTSDVTVCATLMEKPPRPIRSQPPGITKDVHGAFLPPSDPNPIAIPSKPVPFTMTGELEREYRATSVAAPAVLTLLGARYAYIKVDPIPLPKGQLRTFLHVEMVFFSHTYNKAVSVTIREGRIENSAYSQEWPTEGREEVDAAVALARLHPAMVGRLQGLSGGAMLAQPLRGRAPWIGNRVLDVRFFDDKSVSKYMALVDLTTLQVLDAGPVR